VAAQRPRAAEERLLEFRQSRVGRMKQELTREHRTAEALVAAQVELVAVNGPPGRCKPEPFPPEAGIDRIARKRRILASIEGDAGELAQKARGEWTEVDIAPARASLET